MCEFRDVRAPGLARRIGIDAIALQRWTAASEQPVGGGRPFAVQGFDHGVLVVAHEIDHLGAWDRRAVEQMGDHATGVDAAVDIVADVQQ